MARNSSSNQQEHCDEGISIRDKDVVQTSKQHEMNEMEALNTPADQEEATSSNTLLSKQYQMKIKEMKYHLPLAVLMCLFFGNPLGIFAIREANRLKRALRRNDMEAAYTHSKNMRALYMSGVCIGIFLYTIVVIVLIVVFGISPNTGIQYEQDFPDE